MARQSRLNGNAIAGIGWQRLALGAVVVIAGGWFLLHYLNKPKGPPPQVAIPVTEGKVETKDMPVYVRGIGTVQAFNTVAIKSRVDGQITQVLFDEGQEVKAGDPLFQIDPRPYQAALEQAEGGLAKDQAQLGGAQLDLERYGKLVGPGYQTRQSFDDQRATVGQVQGSAKADQGLIDASKLNIEYASIRSPITGRTGARLVDIGNLIQASQGTNLVTVTQMKPIYVSFTIPQDALDQLLQNQAKGQLAVIAYASDDKTVLGEGKLTLIDNQVDTTTGTVRLKGTFANDDERLWPGEFVNARVVVSTRKNALVVPSQTVMQGSNGYYTYTIQPDGTAKRQVVKVAATQDGLTVVETGLNAGDNVIVEGQYRLTDGSKIKTSQPQQQKQAGDAPQPTQQAN
jgi:multidrug efflux system membrane fusion protein